MRRSFEAEIEQLRNANNHNSLVDESAIYSNQLKEQLQRLETTLQTTQEEKNQLLRQYEQQAEEMYRMKAQIQKAEHENRRLSQVIYLSFSHLSIAPLFNFVFWIDYYLLTLPLYSIYVIISRHLLALKLEKRERVPP